MNFKKFLGFLPMVDKIFVGLIIFSAFFISIGQFYTVFVRPARFLKDPGTQVVPLDAVKWKYVYDIERELAEKFKIPTPNMFFHPDTQIGVLTVYDLATPSIVLSGGFLKNFSESEVKAILADTLLKIANKSIYKTLALGAGAFLFSVCFHALRWIFIPFGSIWSIGLAILIEATPMIDNLYGKLMNPITLSMITYQDEFVIRNIVDAETFMSALKKFYANKQYACSTKACSLAKKRMANVLLEQRIAHIQCMTGRLA